MSVRLDSRMNRSQVDCRVCPSMKSFIAPAPGDGVLGAELFVRSDGCTAVVLMRSNTGAMMNSERNSAMPTSTWLDGVVCSQRLRRMAKTMTMR